MDIVNAALSVGVLATIVLAWQSHHRSTKKLEQRIHRLESDLNEHRIHEWREKQRTPEQQNLTDLTKKLDAQAKKRLEMVRLMNADIGVTNVVE